MKRRMILTAAISLLLTMSVALPSYAGWVKNEANGFWQYYSDNGNTVTGWLQEDEKWYYLDGGGTMKTGWVKDNGSWYFMYDSGVMATDTWIDNYYVNGRGKWTKTR